MNETDLKTAARLETLAERFDRALGELEEASSFAKARYQTPVFRTATDLLDHEDGIARVYAQAPRFDDAGVFHAGPWEDPAKLLPELVGVGLMGDGVYPSVEALSDLRVLAVAEGGVRHSTMDRDAAREFLRAAVAKNLHLMFPRATEDRRVRPRVHARAERLFRFIADHVTLEGLREQVIEEIELLCAQRPIMTGKIRALLETAAELPADAGADQARIDVFSRAVGAATPGSREAPEPRDYRLWLQRADRDVLAEEARIFAASLAETGLGSPYHAVLLRRLQRAAPELLGRALGLDETGAAEFAKDPEFCGQLVRAAIFPITADSIYGLKALLERGLPSRTEVAGGLRRLIDLDIRPEVQDALLQRLPRDTGLSANSVLLAGAVSVLGQPLGVSQGNNPTCQAARGISLWSQHAPGLLLGMISNAARDGVVECDFEGQLLKSSEILFEGRYDTASLELDAVSLVLVPHLDRLYFRMQQLAAYRGEDPHRWVNPALYGRWVHSQFVSAVDALTGAVKSHGDFVRRFYATHHPDYNDGYELIYPNPVGIMVTNVHGLMLGPHAVSIQRIAVDPRGELRIYFFNPNDEGRQDWGHGVTPRVSGTGERHGESSLPFDQFVSRMYAFHYDPYEEGEVYAVPADLVRRVVAMARESWGRSYTWSD